MEILIILLSIGAIWFLVRAMKRKSDQRKMLLMQDMMSAAAEGSQRKKINKAIETAGLPVPYDDDTTQYCTVATARLVEAIILKSGKDTMNANDKEMFVGCLFTLIVGNHLSRLLNVQFEFVTAAAPVMIYDKRIVENDILSEAIENYNDMIVSGNSISLIGQGIAEWLNDPNDLQLERIANYFLVTIENATISSQ
jgi:hypothetical protein